MEFIIGTGVLIATFWMIVIAIRNEQIGWALGMFLLFPITLIYGLLNWSEAKIPFLIMASAFVTVWAMI